MKQELKIGIFMAVAVFLLAVWIFIVGGLGFLFKKQGYPLYVSFDSAAGLEKRSEVKMAGVKIGYIKDIVLKGRQAQVLLNIDSEVEVPRDSKATLAALGLLGEKHIEILPGEEPIFCLPGETIEGVPLVSFDQVGTMLLAIGNEFQEMGRILSGMIGGEESRVNFRDTLRNLSSFTADLKEFFGTNKEELRQGLQRSSQAVQKFEQRVEETSQNLDELIFLLKDMVEENRENIKINLESIKELLDNLEKSLKLLHESLEKINKGEGTLGKLIHQQELYQRAEGAVGKLEKVIHPVSNLRFSAELRIEYYRKYYGKSNLLKSYFTLSLWPTKKKYLLAQIIHDPWLDKFIYSAQGGLRWGAISPRVGIIESEVGAGVDYYAVGDRLKLSLESFDFNRRPRPHFRFRTRYTASKYFYLLFGIDNFTLAPKREIFFGLELGF